MVIPPFKIIFIDVKTQHDIQEFAKIVHLYYIDGIFDKKDVETWLGEIECDLDKVTKTKISFNFFDTYFPTHMTIYQNGRCVVETDLDSLK